MTINGWLQIGVFLAAILAVTVPLGRFMARVFNRERTWLDPVLRPLERLIYRLTLVDERREMRWTEYAGAMLLFSTVSMLLLYLIQRAQSVLPCSSMPRFGAHKFLTEQQIKDVTAYLFDPASPVNNP